MALAYGEVNQVKLISHPASPGSPTANLCAILVLVNDLRSDIASLCYPLSCGWFVAKTGNKSVGVM